MPADLMRTALIMAAIAAALLLLALGAALGGSLATLEPGAPAPLFTMTTYDGETMALADLRGSVVVLNFWASWCKECEYEAADLEAVWREYKDRGVWVLGVAYTDTEPAARAYLERFAVTYPNGPDGGGRISRAYRLTGVPETVVIAPDGRLEPLALRGAAPAAKVVGPIIPGAPFGPQDLRAVVERLAEQIDTVGAATR